MPARSSTSYSPALGNQGPHTNALPECPQLPGQQGLPRRVGWSQKPWRGSGTRSEHGGRASQPPPLGPFPQPQSSHVYQAPPLPTGRGGAGSDIRGPPHNHRCLPHPDPQRPSRDSLMAAETAEHRWVGPIWGTQAAGPQLWTSSPGTQLASPGLCPQGKQAEGWAAPLPALSSHLHPSFTLRRCQTTLPVSSSR